LVGHRLDTAGVLQLHLPRHQQGAYLHVGSGLRFPHLLDGLASMQTKVIGQRADEVGTERSMRAFQRSARVSKFSKWKVPLPGGQARRNKLLVSWGPLVIAAPLAGSLVAPLRCAGPCQFRGTGLMEYRARVEDHSPLTPAARITLPHFSVNSTMSLLN